MIQNTFDSYSKFELDNLDPLEIHGVGGADLPFDPRMFMEMSQTILKNRISQIDGAFPEDSTGLIGRAKQAYNSGVGTKAAIDQLQEERDCLQSELNFLQQSLENRSPQTVSSPDFIFREIPVHVDDICKFQSSLETHRQTLAATEKKLFIKIQRITYKILRYLGAQTLLMIFVPCVWLLDLFSLIEGLFYPNNAEKKLKKGLKTFVQEDDDEKIIAHFQKIRYEPHLQNPPATKNLLIDFLAMKEIHQDLHQVLKGANVVFLDGGKLFHSWKNWEGVYQRISSHNHEPGNCRGIKSKVFKEVLFWLDYDGNTRLQLEKSPLKGLGNQFRHLVDFLRYFRDGLQQGPYGVSDKVESDPLIVDFDLEAFEKNKR